MIKNVNSKYVPNERKDSWLKLKPEYMEGAGDDLDLIILGGYYGAGIGRRGGTISHFMVGVKAPIANATPDPNSPILFYSLAKVGSGYTDAELNQLQKMLEKHWRVFDTSNPPSCFMLAEPFKEKPDVWIHPNNSKILQIKAAQIVPSEKY